MAALGYREQPPRTAHGQRLFRVAQPGRVFHYALRSGSTARILASLAVWFLLAPGMGAGARSSPPDEYEVKAAFLYNFGKFVEWPASAFSSDSFLVCVLGADPFGRVLDATIEGRMLRDKKVVIRRFARIEDTVGCHTLFISSSERGRLEEILLALKGRNVLTVGDTAGFAERGTMINFRIEDNKVRFEINVTAAERAGLSVSSHLQRLATVVRENRLPGD